MVKYKKAVAGQWVLPRQKDFKLGCCDCGLVHVFDFRIMDKKVEYRVWRDNRATAAMRRGRRYKHD
jgi:hypothetical protein